MKAVTFLPCIFLSIFSCLVIYSIAPDRLYHQIGFFLAGFALYLIARKIGIDTLIGFSPIAYIILLLLLLLTLGLGITVKGSSRWLGFGFLRLQPSEWAKAILALFLPYLIGVDKINWQRVLLFFTLFGFIFLTVFFQPDLGSSLALLIVFLTGFSLSKIKLRYKVSFFIFLLCLAPMLFPLLKPYQKNRFIHFLNPYSDPSGAGYNVIQSVVAIGSGGFFGKGLGLGSQSQLHFLPEQQTDFIFASLVEELGFIGGAVVLIMYFWLFVVILNIYRLQENNRNRMVTAGIFLVLLMQVVINVGMNMGILPVTGLPLPLISVGGNSILVTMFMLGVLESLPLAYSKKPSLTIG
jgi:rod shape determining protein RodA